MNWKADLSGDDPSDTVKRIAMLHFRNGSEENCKMIINPLKDLPALVEAKFDVTTL